MKTLLITATSLSLLSGGGAWIWSSSRGGPGESKEGLIWIDIKPHSKSVLAFRAMDSEVTVGQYLAYLDLIGKSDDPWAAAHREENPHVPATGLTKPEMKRYAYWLGQTLRSSRTVSESEVVRLPTDAEFSEMAGLDASTERGNTPAERLANNKDGLLLTGDSRPPAPNLGNFMRKGDNLAERDKTEIGAPGEGGDNYLGLSPVRSFPDGRVNGLYDLAGGAYEVIEDTLDGTTDCMRGASYKSNKLSELQRAYRVTVALPQPDAGFRLVCAPKK